jgi:hypothetical protein
VDAPRINYLGLGAQKCASSWVHRVLSEHPQACLSVPKELDYFSYYYGRGQDWYERHFAPTALSRIVGDNSPSYFVHPLAPVRAARYNPAMKLVLALRDPIERAYSNHLHLVREGFITGSDLTFEHGLERNEMYVEQSRYATHLGHWLKSFPREQIHVVLQEDLVDDAEDQAQRLYDFLGLDRSFRARAISQRANESSIMRQDAAARVVKGGAQVLKGVGLGRLVTAAAGHASVQRWRRSKQVSLREVVPPMKPQTRESLRRQLAPEVDALHALLLRDTFPWPDFAGAVPRAGQDA